MPRHFVEPGHPWFHPDFPVEHEHYGHGGDAVTVHADHHDGWRSSSVYVKAGYEGLGKGPWRVDLPHGGDRQGIDQIEAHHKAYGHALHIARDMATQSVARSVVRAQKTPLDILHTLKDHPDHIVRRTARYRLKLVGEFHGDPDANA